MNRERKTGLAFLGGAIALVVAIVVVLTVSASADLRYTVLFAEGKGVKVGDKVQLNGIDVGEVENVRLERDGEQVRVKVRIEREHREKIGANSTAYIADPTLVNVSGRKVVEVHNGSPQGAPIRPGAEIVGKDGWIELKAWQGKEALKEWGEAIGGAAGDLREGAKSLTDGAREAVGAMGKGAADSVKEGAADAAKDLANDGIEYVAPDSKKVGELMAELGALLAELGTAGAGAFERLSGEWDALKQEAAPMIESLKNQGQRLAAEGLKKAMESVEAALEALREQSESGGDGETPQPDPERESPVI